MKTIRRVYVVAFILSTLGGYALVFGEVGYIKRKGAKTDLIQLQRKVSLLKAENRYLNEQYALFSSKIKSKKLARKETRNLNLTILKFEEETPSKPNLFDLFSNHKNSIIEARLLFLVIMLFFGSCIYFCLHRLEKKENQVKSK